ncbi:MAG: SMC-Scp complex subunit ScpB, partial [Planctomycetota bacterium]
GVACGELLRHLMERDLIRIAGRSEELGRPYLYDTTKQFLQLFGLPSVDSLPEIQWETVQDDAPVINSSEDVEITEPIDDDTA